MGRGELERNIFEEKNDTRNENNKSIFSVRCIGWEDERREDAYVIKEVRASA
jgi:hypothetical protein